MLHWLVNNNGLLLLPAHPFVEFSARIQRFNLPTLLATLQYVHMRGLNLRPILSQCWIEKRHDGVVLIGRLPLMITMLTIVEVRVLRIDVLAIEEYLVLSQQRGINPLLAVWWYFELGMCELVHQIVLLTSGKSQKPVHARCCCLPQYYILDTSQGRVVLDCLLVIFARTQACLAVLWWQRSSRVCDLVGRPIVAAMVWLHRVLSRIVLVS